MDPFFGARARLDLNDDFVFEVRGDIGGFGAGSDFTWNTHALLGYRFSLFGAGAQAFAGYKALAQNYKSGSGTSEFRWDTILRGPVIGMNVKILSASVGGACGPGRTLSMKKRHRPRMLGWPRN